MQHNRHSIVLNDRVGTELKRATIESLHKMPLWKPPKSSCKSRTHGRNRINFAQTATVPITMETTPSNQTFTTRKGSLSKKSSQRVTSRTSRERVPVKYQVQTNAQTAALSTKSILKYQSTFKAMDSDRLLELWHKDDDGKDCQPEVCPSATSVDTCALDQSIRKTASCSEQPKITARKHRGIRHNQCKVKRPQSAPQPVTSKSLSHKPDFGITQSNPSLKDVHVLPKNDLKQTPIRSCSSFNSITPGNNGKSHSSNFHRHEWIIPPNTLYYSKNISDQHVFKTYKATQPTKRHTLRKNKKDKPKPETLAFVFRSAIKPDSDYLWAATFMDGNIYSPYARQSREIKPPSSCSRIDMADTASNTHEDKAHCITTNKPGNIHITPPNHSGDKDVSAIKLPQPYNEANTSPVFEELPPASNNDDNKLRTEYRGTNQESPLDADAVSATLHIPSTENSVSCTSPNNVDRLAGPITSTTASVKTKHRRRVKRSSNNRSAKNQIETFNAKRDTILPPTAKQETKAPTNSEHVVKYPTPAKHKHKAPTNSEHVVKYPTPAKHEHKAPTNSEHVAKYPTPAKHKHKAPTNVKRVMKHPANAKQGIMPAANAIHGGKTPEHAKCGTKVPSSTTRAAKPISATTSHDSKVKPSVSNKVNTQANVTQHGLSPVTNVANTPHTVSTYKYEAKPYQVKVASKTCQTDAPSSIKHAASIPPTAQLPLRNVDNSEQAGSALMSEHKATPVVNTNVKIIDNILKCIREYKHLVGKAPLLPYASDSRYPTTTSECRYPTTTGDSTYPNTTSNCRYPTTTSDCRYPTTTSDCRYPTTTSDSKYPTTTSDSTYPTTTSNCRYPTTTSECRYPTTTSDCRYPTTTSDCRYPTTTSDCRYPTTTSDCIYPNTTSDCIYPTTTSDSTYPNTTSNCRYPTTTSNCRYPTTTSDRRYPTTTSDSRYPTTASDTRYPTTTSDTRYLITTSDSMYPTIASDTRCPSTTSDMRSNVSDIIYPYDLTTDSDCRYQTTIISDTMYPITVCDCDGEGASVDHSDSLTPVVTTVSDYSVAQTSSRTPVSSPQLHTLTPILGNWDTTDDLEFLWNQQTTSYRPKAAWIERDK